MLKNKHIFFIDPLEKLSIKKDSSLLWALTLKENGENVYFLFEEDFYFDNSGNTKGFFLYSFSGAFAEDGIYLEKIDLLEKNKTLLEKGDILYMRIDPPFDGRYLRYLWMLNSFKKKGVRVTNDPEGILLYNEKLFAYEQKNSLETYVGSSLDGFMNFIEGLSTNTLIFKPLDLYQGIGVKKIRVDEKISEEFLAMVEEYQGPVVVQPFCEKIKDGEVRSIFFKGKHLASIIKTPLKGEFLANIARGATFTTYQLRGTELSDCERISRELLEKSVELIAFDILDGSISEVNITCPGLLVEVSKAHGKNLTKNLIL